MTIYQIAMITDQVFEFNNLHQEDMFKEMNNTTHFQQM